MFESFPLYLLSAQFSQMYPERPDLFHPRISRFIAAWKGADAWVAMSTLQLLNEVAKRNPEVKTEFEKICAKL